VTQKNTRNGDRMAFFTLEDRMADIECLVFSNRYAEFSHMIRTDNGVYVSGTLSAREDEPPKLLINRMDELVEDSRFRPELVKPTQSVKQEKNDTNAEEGHSKIAPARVAASIGGSPLLGKSRLFLRVPDMEGMLYQKAINLTAIFDGTFPVFFYNAATKEYSKTPIGVSMSDYVYRQFCELLGEENAILK